MGALAAGALVAGACHGQQASPAGGATTTSSVPPTVATGPDGPFAVLTGLAHPDPALAARPALAVAVADEPQALPQAGLQAADVVVEGQIEGGQSRLLAIFQSRDAAAVGPITTVRPDDAKLLPPLHGLMAYAGGPNKFAQLLGVTPVQPVPQALHPGAFSLRSSRAAPFNVFASTARLYQEAPPASPPAPPLLVFNPPGEPFSPLGATAATHLSAAVGARAAVTWDWDPATGVWRRSLGGSPQRLDDGSVLDATNVVVQFVSYKAAFVAGSSGATVPAASLFSTGDALVFSQGRMVKGRWTKPRALDVTNYTDLAGVPVRLTPGRTWIMLVPVGTAVPTM